MAAALPETTAARRLADHVDDPAVRALYLRLVEDVSGLHHDVVVSASGVDVRVELGGHTLCRIVPYRQLIHLHVGETSPWECRVRDEAGYLDALDAIVTIFLRAAGAGDRAARNR